MIQTTAYEAVVASRRCDNLGPSPLCTRFWRQAGSSVRTFIYIGPPPKQKFTFLTICLLATGHKVADLWWQNIELPRR